MLNGGGINPDGLSLDLQFALDKTLTARRGPTPVFIRSSGDNGGTTYFGPLVDLGAYTEFSTTGITNGRASWFKSDGGNDITISYTGTRWRVVVVYGGAEDVYLAAPGSEWRPDQADWSSQDFAITTSSTFGIVKAANNEPRFDHTSAGVCRGLLIEESRANSFQRSDDFGNAYWTKARSTITSDATTSPSGATDADKLVEDTSTNSHIVYRLVSVGVTTPVSFSVFAKASERSWIQLECGDNFTAGSTAYFNLSNGTIGTVGAGATASIQSMGNGWYRCVVVATPTLTTSNGFYVNIATANGTRFYAGDGTSGVFLWGAQVEVGSFATSYIPTTTGSLARSADVCSITGADFTGFTKLGEGSVVVHGDSYQGTTPAFCQFSNDTNGARSFNFQRNSSTGALEHSDSGAGVMTISASPSFPVKFGAARSQALGIRVFYNGVGGTISAFTTNGLQTRMLIGNSGIGLPLNGCIRSIKHFKKRLSSEKMQILTAP